MAKVLRGDEADKELGKEDLTQDDLEEYSLKLSDALFGITRSPCIMVNSLVRVLAAVVTHIERCGDNDIEGVTLSTLKAHMQRIRDGNKKEAN
jgi:hypothetical protein